MRHAVSRLVLGLLFVGLVSAVLIIFGVRNQADALRASFLELEQYTSQHAVPPLKDIAARQELSDADKRQANDLAVMFEKDDPTPELPARAEHLGERMKLLRTFLSATSGNEAITSLRAYAELKQLSYAEGESAPYFKAYNDLALRWNQRTETGKFASVLRLEPTWRVQPDGQTEFLPVIRFK